MKYEFDDSIRRLRKEVDPFLNVSPKGVVLEKPHELKTERLSKNDKSNKIIESDAIIKWDESKVKEWFKKNNLNIAIMESLSPCTGDVLFQLNEMKNEAPEFFYHSIKNDSINMNSLLKFTFQLKILFK